MNNTVYIINQYSYSIEDIKNKLPDKLFNSIKSDSKVVIKPNWVKESHEFKPDDWNYVITHPDIITAVLIRVLDKLNNKGQISIIDSPETPSSFKKITMHYPVAEWEKLSKEKGIKFEIIDLRDDEWSGEDGIITVRKKLSGDPRGKIGFNLYNKSEFASHKKSVKGYYGADYDIFETNEAHDGYNNKYKISKTVIDYDVFINIPKLKTHKKGGMTCCLKNLVGVNTYKNYLPHYSLGNPADGGDQFPERSIKNKIESNYFSKFKQHILLNAKSARITGPLLKYSRKIFGDTSQKIRSGNWYGNDTIWRMIIDLNKIVLYGNIDGTMREGKPENRKTYIGIVDGILAGEGSGPKAPDPKELNLIIAGTEPLLIDTVCARLMAFDPLKIPMIKNSYGVINYPISFYGMHEICLDVDGLRINYDQLPDNLIKKFIPHFGWKNQIEYEN